MPLHRIGRPRPADRPPSASRSLFGQGLPAQHVVPGPPPRPRPFGSSSTGTNAAASDPGRRSTCAAIVRHPSTMAVHSPVCPCHLRIRRPASLGSIIGNPEVRGGCPCCGSGSMMPGSSLRTLPSPRVRPDRPPSPPGRTAPGSESAVLPVAGPARRRSRPDQRIHRHPVMDWRDQRVGIGGDNGAALDPLALRGLPVRPQAGEAERPRATFSTIRKGCFFEPCFCHS